MLQFAWSVSPTAYYYKKTMGLDWLTFKVDLAGCIMCKCSDLRKVSFFPMFLLFILINISGCTSMRNNDVEVIYRFNVQGNDCNGITYGWLSEENENQSCHDNFTDGDVRMNCPIPKSVSIIFSSPKELSSYKPVSSYISVSSSSTCIAQCEIWISGELEASDDAITIEDDHIASCNSRVH
jgi:hypothetical protein